MFRLHAGVALIATRRYLLRTSNGAITAASSTGNTGSGQSHCHRGQPVLLLQPHASNNDAIVQARRGTWTERRSASGRESHRDGGGCANCTEPRTLIIGRVSKINSTEAPE